MEYISGLPAQTTVLPVKLVGVDGVPLTVKFLNPLEPQLLLAFTLITPEVNVLLNAAVMELEPWPLCNVIPAGKVQL